jgi:hypothetical protein
MTSTISRVVSGLVVQSHSLTRTMLMHTHTARKAHAHA